MCFFLNLLYDFDVFDTVYASKLTESSRNPKIRAKFLLIYNRKNKVCVQNYLQKKNKNKNTASTFESFYKTNSVDIYELNLNTNCDIILDNINLELTKQIFFDNDRLKCYSKT